MTEPISPPQICGTLYPHAKHLVTCSGQPIVEPLNDLRVRGAELSERGRWLQEQIERLEAVRDTALTAEQEIRVRLAESRDLPTDPAALEAVLDMLDYVANWAATGLLPGLVVDEHDGVEADLTILDEVCAKAGMPLLAWQRDLLAKVWPRPDDGPDDACRDGCPEGIALRKENAAAEYEVSKTRAERDNAARTALELREELHTARVERDNARADAASLGEELDRVQARWDAARTELDALKDLKQRVDVNHANACATLRDVSAQRNVLLRQRDKLLSEAELKQLDGSGDRTWFTPDEVVAAFETDPQTASSATESAEAGVAGVAGGTERQRGSEAVGDE